MDEGRISGIAGCVDSGQGLRLGILFTFRHTSV